MIRNLAANSCFFLLGTLLIYVPSGCNFYSPNERVDSLFTILGGVKYFYDLNSPVEKYIMPDRLVEISGISYVSRDHLICVEDENGIVYHYSLESEEVIDEWKFSGDGDYEDVLYFEDSVYVLKSDGDIYQFHFSKSGAKNSSKYENQLSYHQDTEGLGLDPVGKNLLVACKEKKDHNGKDTDGWNVYSFNLATKSMLPIPFYSLTSSRLKSFFEANRDFTYEEERIVVKPSGIAFNPLDKNFYILASVGKMIVVIDSGKQIKATYSVPENLLEQPEGIAFGPDGDLWISSEGVGGPGRILSFNPQSK